MAVVKNSIKVYPVGNGDQTLITLSDETTLLVDCNIREGCKGDDNKEMYDVHKDLLSSIKRRNKIPFVDVFILTHGDQDHCRGFKANFYQGDPKNYGEKHLKEELIIMDTMWFSPMIAEQYTNDDEDAHQCEAERRLKMHREKHAEKDNPGNRIKIIGYDSNKDYKDLNHLRAVPGDIVSRFNDKDHDTFSIFIHAPFKIHLDSNEKDKNSASIVFQARFKESSTSKDFSCLVFFTGDSDYTTWETILKRTKRFKNDVNKKALNWDIFIAPHHCSWTFFNQHPQEDNPEPVATSLEALSFKNKGAKVVASSKKIKNNTDNPPHHKAKAEYVKVVGESNFLNTSTNDMDGDTPQPIIFVLTPNGPTKSPNSKIGGALTSGGGGGAASTFIKQGSQNVF
ncbi:hypothetical protein [Mucilaginibacter sp.]|jgi:hypothetical protein|uniref:hypothetical protein n=1 Tax=Mucilaginibacter sp. TaxID=1882438 RepID=UPI003563C5DB